MPKTKYLYDKQEKQNETAAKNSRQLAGEIGRICGIYDIAEYELAREIGIPQPTFSRRMKNPNTFTYGELTRIKKRFPEFSITAL